MTQHIFANYLRQQTAIEIRTQQELVDAARSGDEEAFLQLWNHHSKRLFGTILRIVKIREDAEDLLQEACLNSFINIQRFDGRSQISTWITRIAINAAFMALRRRRVRQELSAVKLTNEDGWRLLEFVDESIDIEEEYARNERITILWQAVTRLPPKLRIVVEMYLSHDLSVSDIAALSGTSVAATKSRLYRARGALNRSLGCKLYWTKSCGVGAHNGRVRDSILSVDRLMEPTPVDVKAPEGTTGRPSEITSLVSPSTELPSATAR